MLRIGICDDEKRVQKELNDMVSHIVFQYDDVEFSYYSSGQEVVSAIEKKQFFCDLLLLDIHMPQLDGLETAKYIRMHQVDVDIMFITVSQEHVFDGYTYQAFSYLLKPVNLVRLEDEISRYIFQQSKSSRCLHISVNGKKEKVLLDKVKYFEADGRKMIIHQLSGERSFYAKISDLEEMLKEYGFIRNHQSYLVNSMFVTGHSRTEIKLGETVVPVSRKYVESVREALDTGKEK